MEGNECDGDEVEDHSDRLEERVLLLRFLGLLTDKSFLFWLGGWTLVLKNEAGREFKCPLGDLAHICIWSQLCESGEADRLRRDYEATLWQFAIDSLEALQLRCIDNIGLLAEALDRRTVQPRVLSRWLQRVLLLQRLEISPWHEVLRQGC